MAELTGRALIASRCAKFFKDGDFVNLGIGLPLMCVNYLPEGVDLWLEAEIGIVGCGASPSWEDADPDLIDAGGQPASVIPGGSVCDHATSFAYIRGGMSTRRYSALFRSIRRAISRTGRFRANLHPVWAARWICVRG